MRINKTIDEIPVTRISKKMRARQEAEPLIRDLNSKYDAIEKTIAEMNLKGTIRNPDGAYLVQKKGLKFLPLHDVQKDMDAKIRETSLYID